MFSSSGDATCLLRNPMFLPYPNSKLTKENFYYEYANDTIWSLAQVGFLSDKSVVELWITIDLGIERVIANVNLFQSEMSTMYTNGMSFNILFCQDLRVSPFGSFPGCPNSEFQLRGYHDHFCMKLSMIKISTRPGLCNVDIHQLLQVLRL